MKLKKTSSKSEPNTSINKEINASQNDVVNADNNGAGWLSILTLVIAALLVAVVLTAFVFQQYEVDGPSMQPTLQNSNRLVVVKVQKTLGRITGHPWVPKRGNIIIFTELGLYNSAGIEEKQLVKRVIGLPGDHLVIKNGVITIYNKQHPNGFDPDKTMGYFGKNPIPYTSGNINIIVPAGDVFVCGDNRGDSLDSRYFGPVPVKNIIGKLDLRVFHEWTVF
jgi:signal peptidase I